MVNINDLVDYCMCVGVKDKHEEHIFKDGNMYAKDSHGLCYNHFLLTCHYDNDIKFLDKKEIYDLKVLLETIE